MLAAALAKCATDKTAAAKQIAKALGDKASQVRRNAAVALGILGEKAVLADLVTAGRKAQSTFERRAIDQAIRSLTKDK